MEGPKKNSLRGTEKWDRKKIEGLVPQFIKFKTVYFSSIFKHKVNIYKDGNIIKDNSKFQWHVALYSASK